ncbi:hypothetical protein [Fulvivirga ligni]|uniref:hypothetical protein n=1 Tax=Fulvivirga ligni TaxID=2904246 RepID=UPI001F25073F|nr:hypothetical protein [Fulvivirga ligni]UII21529.1 hypothetical protein LVD16_27250 [Fulvivirga ligni]
MKNYIKIIVLSIIGLIPLTKLNAQDLKNSLNEMREAYEQMTDLHIKMDVKAYASKELKEEMYSLDVDIKKKGDNYLYNYGGNAMLMNDRYLIMVDGSAKEMVCSKRANTDENMMASAFQFNLDSILSFYEEPVFLRSEGAIEQFKVNQKEGPVSELYLSINSNTKMLTQIAYLYRQGAYVRIDFKLFDGHAKLSDQMFNETNFIRLDDGKLSASAAYKGYHFVETTSN